MALPLCSPPSPLLRRPPPLRLSLQTPPPLDPPHENESSSSSSSSKPSNNNKNKSIWINPNSPRGPSLLLNSADSRYSRLSLLSSSLDLSSSPNNIPLLLSSSLPSPPPLPDAITILNTMHNPSSALPTLLYFLQHIPSPSPQNHLILFNLTLKLLRNSPSSTLHQAHSLLTHMLRTGITPDNITLSTLITFATSRNLPSKALHFFRNMPRLGLTPDHITYSAIIHSYARIGDLHSALALYDRARTDRCRLDPLAFATVIRLYAASGNFDGALNVFQEMKALRVKPDLLTYNKLLDAMCRARRPWQVKNIYKQMLANNNNADRITYSNLIRAYSQARYAADALAVYREMRRQSMDLNLVLYNMLLSMCADIGYVDEAVEIFGEMKDPDSWSYSSLITAYSCAGNVAEAERMLGAMMEAGFQPTIFVLTSIVQCYGKAGRIDDVVRTFDRMLELGISPDERFCGCLLNVLARAPPPPGDDELWKVIRCIDRSDPRLGAFVKLMVVDLGTSEEMLKRGAEQLFGGVGEEVRKAYCNCLIDMCVNMNQPGRASVLLNLALEVGIYSALQSKSVTQWSLHVRSLSLGAALTALRLWMSDMTKAMENGEELPPLLGIHTGHGKHKYSERGLAAAFVPHLRELNAPFHEATDKVGWFLTTNIAAKLWLQSRAPVELVVA